jgi:hypothetical protein
VALHGDIRVSGRRIGYWSTRRLECNQHNDGRDVGVCPASHDYECYVEWYDLDGHQHRDNFTLPHTYAEGALALASKILTEAVNGR